MFKPSPPFIGLAIVTAALMIVSASLHAGAEKLEPVLRNVPATSSLTVTYVPSKGFHVQGDDPKTAVDAVSPRLGLLPMFKGGKLASVSTVTYAPAKEQAAKWPALVTVAETKAQHIATSLHVTFEPVFEKALLRGYKIATIASRKGAADEGEVTPAGKESKRVETKKIMLELPKKRAVSQWFGVLLTPVLDKNKALKGFDVTLVSTPRKQD